VETQVLELKQGWNAVYLEVQPEPRRCEEVFKAVPLESVWMWNPSTSTAQFLTLPELDALKPASPWLTYWPEGRDEHELSNLFHMLGGRAYLVKASARCTVSLSGMPVIPHVDWVQESYNLVGFHVGLPDRSGSLSPELAAFEGPWQLAGTELKRLVFSLTSENGVSLWRQ